MTRSKKQKQYEREYHAERRANDPDYCQRAKEKSHQAFLKIREWLNNYKSNLGCIDCRINDFNVLDIDHVTGKTMSLTYVRSIDLAHSEIQDGKCVVRCTNCHRLKTWCDLVKIDYVHGDVPLIMPDNKVARHKAQYKLKRGCTKCGYNAHFAPLDFHHVDGKGAVVSRITTIERFILEMALFPCEILCSNCHRIHHSLERSQDQKNA